ncbi:MAG: gliding motility-associated C-terminal domain-containing protein [Chitinophagales bacterium]|nr:gliding motility-associated C-terminal domain-containing protein [Chitinophagales bacterium]MDW8419529.1 gliding motility-associated C-terminal domain-containing protein [Chitinophagales bacterium]
MCFAVWMVGQHILQAQTTTTCFEIESILVDACVPGGGCNNANSPACNCEGKNEMVRFLVGPNPLQVSNLNVQWPNNSYLGICQNATTAAHVAALNATIQSCGYLLEPTGGVLPANSKVLLITSVDMCVAANSFANLSDTLYVIFQCPGNYLGHFANYNVNPNTFRTLRMNFGPGCGDTVTYDANLLVDQNGIAQNSPPNLRDGASVRFSFNNVATYYNNGCNAPVPVPTVNILTNSGNDTSVCHNTPSVLLTGQTANVKSRKWITAGSGTFSSDTAGITTYQFASHEVFPVTIFLRGYTICNDSVTDTIRIHRLANPINAGTDASICAGKSTTLSASGGTNYVWSPATYISNPSSPSPSVFPPVTTPYVLTGNYGPGNTCIGKDTVMITVTPRDSIVLNFKDTVICQGKSVSVQVSNVTGVSFNPPTGLSCSNCLNPIATPQSQITYVVTSQGACPDTETLKVNVDVPTQVVQPVTACGFYTFKGVTYTANTTLLDTVKNVRGCDSILITLPLTIRPTHRDTVRRCILQGETYIAGGAPQTASGFYTDTYTNQFGCDSIVVTHLRVISPVSQSQTLTGCKQVVLGGVTYTASFTKYDTLKTTLGCDSVYITTHIMVHPASPVTNRSVCIYSGQSFYAGGANQTTSGIYYDTLQNINGCDSVIITNLRVVSPTTSTTNLSGCPGFVYQNVAYYNTTTITDTIRTSLGCDSIYRIVQINIQPSLPPSYKQICVLSGQSYYAGGSWQTTSGIYNDTLSSSSGCDSVVITNLQVISTITLTETYTGCESYNYNGVTYYTSTVLRDTTRSVLGCDSIYHVVNITILPASTFSKAVCIQEGESYYVGGTFQTTSGIYRDTLANTNGCDSIIVTELQVIKPTEQRNYLQGCDSVQVNNVWYYHDTTIVRTVIPSELGCDSVIIYDSITILPVVSYNITSDKAMPIEAGESVTLSANYNGPPASFTWSPNEGIVSGGNQTTVVVAPQITTAYTLHFTTTEPVCKRTDTFLVVVKEPSMLFAVPTAFSPNGDGVNDLFRPLLRSDVEVEEFRIYNRWGEMVYEWSTNTTGWDGTYKGVSQPLGTYVYYLTVKHLPTNTRKFQKGNITLLR